MKKKGERLEPIQGISRTEASYEKLMLEMMSKLVFETKENNRLIQEHFGKSPPKAMAFTHSGFKEKSNLPLRVTAQDWSEVDLVSPEKHHNEIIIEEVY
jgi:hypothetical protein